MDTPITTLYQAFQDTTNIPDSKGQNLFSVDDDLPGLLKIYLDARAFSHFLPQFERLGKIAGERLDGLAFLADKYTPVLTTRDRTGAERDEIYKHPAYVELERWAFSEFGMAAASHVPGVLGWHEPLPNVAKYTLFYLFSQTEFGLTCPVNMTDSLTRTLKKYGSKDLVEKYFDKLTSLDFDTLYQGAMFMTEQGAGSDIAKTETVAQKSGNHWKLYGQKWFCSNADADLAMVLARPEGAPAGMAGVTLFLLPKEIDGQPNQYRILRLKDKLGTRSMPSGEIRFDGATAYIVGEIGRGFQQMAEMVNSSRLSNGLRSGALMRRALTESLYVANHRQAFGVPLIKLPLIQRQLDKMRLPTEQARSFGFHLASVLEKADSGNASAKKIARIMTPLIKFRACRDARKVAGDAMEIRGGCGYIEEWIEARLVRESHLGSIWEGTSNIVALDVYRAIERNQALAAFQAHFEKLQETLPDDEFKKQLGEYLTIATTLAARHAALDRQETAREISSLLYHTACAILFAWEAAHPGLEHRAALVRQLARYRIAPLIAALEK